jgi:CheY-like chemotaxis protein
MLAGEVLSRSITSAARGGPLPMITHNFEGLKVVVVDDDPGILTLIGRCLLLKGASPTLCETALEGIRAVRDVRPDLILLDIVMPVRDGFRFLQDLKELRPSRATPIPVLVVTGVRDPDVEAALRARGIGYLAKPFTLGQLFNSIAQRMSEAARLSSHLSESSVPVTSLSAS